MQALLADRRLEGWSRGAVRSAVFEDSGEIRERVTTLHPIMIPTSTP
jgi:hypothetical protein